MTLENFMLKAVSRSLLATAGALIASSAMASDITGAGASFPAPIYASLVENEDGYALIWSR